MDLTEAVNLGKVGSPIGVYLLPEANFVGFFSFLLAAVRSYRNNRRV